MQFVLSGAILAARAWAGHGVGHAPSLTQRREASSGGNSPEKLLLTDKRQTGIGDGHNLNKKHGGTGVAKREWGAKHTCMGCGVKFYDLHRNPIACPKCGSEIEVETARPSRRRPLTPSTPAPPSKEETMIGGADESADDDTEDAIDDIDDDDDVVEEIEDAGTVRSEP